jgi:uncharacterized protein (UPF0218 family)
MRAELKKPLGLLLEGEPDETVARLKEILEAQNPPMFATVGDFVSGNILAKGLKPDIVVVDNRIMRVNIDPIEFERDKVHVVNSPGTISGEARRALEKAVTLKKRLAVVVEGEEDLLVLPLMVVIPAGSVIIYGQPREGMVVVTVTEERRAWARGFMEKMEEERD